MCSPLTNVSASPLHSCTPVPCNADLLNTAYRGTESSACRKLCTLCMDVCSLLLPWPAAEPRRHCCLGHRMLRLLFRLPVPCLQVIAGEHHSHCPMVIGLAIQEHGPSQGTPGPPGAWLDHATNHRHPPAQSLRQGSHLRNALTSRAIPQGKHKKGYEKLYTKREEYAEPKCPGPKKLALTTLRSLASTRAASSPKVPPVQHADGSNRPATKATKHKNTPKSNSRGIYDHSTGGHKTDMVSNRGPSLDAHVWCCSWHHLRVQLVAARKPFEAGWSACWRAILNAASKTRKARP